MPFANPPVPLASTAPVPESTAPVIGNDDTAARANHSHPRLTSSTVQSLGADGTAVVMFTRLFTNLPAVTCLLYEIGPGQPVVFKLSGWVQDANNNYTGCIITGVRASLLPSLSGIGLLTGLIGALSNLNVFGASAAGAQFCCIALQPSN